MKKLKEMTKKNKKIIVLIAVLLLLVIGGAYAWLTLTLRGGNTNVVKAGNLNLEIISESNEINLSGEKAQPLPDAEGLELKEYEFTISNTGSLKSDYTVYLDDVDLNTGEERMTDKYIDYTLNSNEEIKKLKETGSNPNRIIDEGTINSGETKVYKLRLWIDKEADNTVMGKTFTGKIRIEATQSRSKETNKNIMGVYQYNETAGDTQCITGEETTCKQVSVTNNDTLKTGTIVKYAVNESEEKYFYVLHDDGETITLQQRENTIRNVAWYADSNDNSKGPLTILPQLESATANWTMSAASANSARAWIVYRIGYVNTFETTSTNYGARAVIVINK